MIQLSRLMRKLISLTMYVVLLSACGVFNEYGQLPGVAYVASLGSPRANSIIWSPTEANKALVSANSLIRHAGEVYILDLGTGQKTKLVDAEYGEVWGMDWLPDGNHVVLSVGDGTDGFPHGGLWLINIEDQSVEYFLDKAGDILWLQDEKMIAIETRDYKSNKSPAPLAIALVDNQTKESEIIYSTDKAIAFGPGFSSSRNGQYLAFSLLSDFNSLATNIYVLNVQSKEVIQLTSDGASSSPQWSPQGDLLVYEKRHTAGDITISRLHLMVPDSGCDVVIPNLDNVFSPAWSPDGQSIAFIGEDGIYVSNLNELLNRNIYDSLCP